MRNLYTYDHSPPDMVKGCLAFIEVIFRHIIYNYAKLYGKLINF